MPQIIQRTLGSVALLIVAALPISPAAAQTQQQFNWCLHKDDAFSPALRIDGCSATIKAGRQSGKDLSRVFYNRGIAYAKSGQHDRAIADFDQAIRLDPDSIFALNNRGAAYARKGQYDDAIADFNEAIRINASNALTYNNRGIAYAKKGLYDRAIEDFDQAIRFDPDDANALKNRGLAKRLRGDIAGANADEAEAQKKRSLAAQMKETTPGAETIEAHALKNGSVTAPPSDISPKTVTPKIDANEAPAVQKRGGAKPIDVTASEADRKIASPAKTSRRVSVASKSRSKVQHASVRSHRAKSQPALVRFLSKHNPISGLKKVFRLASRRSN